MSDTIQLTKFGKAVYPETNITVPTTLAELSDDSTHRLVSDTEKTEWGGKYSKPTTGIPTTDLADIPKNTIYSIHYSQEGAGISGFDDSNGSTVALTRYTAEGDEDYILATLDDIPALEALTNAEIDTIWANAS